MEENNHPKGRGGVIGGFAGFIKDNAKGLLEGRRVEAMGQQQVQESWKARGLEVVERLPHGVRDVFWTRGGGV